MTYDPLSYTIVGDYIHYARFIENLFRGIITCLIKEEELDHRLEIFTTLNVLPRQWYNVVHCCPAISRTDSTG